MLEHGDHQGLDVDQEPEKDCDVSPATHSHGRDGDRSALLTPARLFTQSITLSASGSRDSGCNSLPFPFRVTHLPASSPWGQAYSICPVSVHPGCPLQDASLSPTQISSLLPTPATRGLSSSICGTLVLPGLNLAAPPPSPLMTYFSPRDGTMAKNRVCHSWALLGKSATT